MSDIDQLLTAAFFVIAALYSSVGHAGASGYIAAMALLSMPAPIIRPVALALNILVGGIGLFRFARARLVPWRIVIPLIAGSAPAAYFGAALKLSPAIYQRVLAAILVIAALQLFRTAKTALDEEADGLVRPMPWPLALLIGAGIGFISGISGTGGAIFLTPLLLFAHFATTRIAAGASVVFVLANSIAGLSALSTHTAIWPPAMPYWLAAVALGALVGTQLGRGILPIGALRRVLAVVLLIAAGKLALA